MPCNARAGRRRLDIVLVALSFGNAMVVFGITYE